MKPGATTQRAQHWLFTGSTGSGKTFTMRQVLTRYLKKAERLVIVNSSEELAEFARHREVVDNAKLERDYSPEQLAALIRRHGSVHFEVAAGEPKRVKAFMNALGEACMLLGQLGAQGCKVLLVIDECQNYVSTKVFSRGMRRVYTEGRKFGIHTMQGTQQFAGTGGEIIDMTMKRMISVLVVCPLDEQNERDRIMATYPELPNPGGLKFPNPEAGRAGEYIIRDRLSRRALRVRVDPGGRRWAVPLAGPLPPKRSAA